MTCLSPRSLAALALLAGLAGVSLPSQGRAADAPPHAWLYGSWAGGLYPAPANITAAECLAHPTFIVTQDSVMHATLTQPGYTQNLIASVRGTPTGTVFTLVPAAAAQPQGPLAGDGDYGCADPGVLRVVKSGDDQISFPGCTAFPSPLVRCPAR